MGQKSAPEGSQGVKWWDVWGMSVVQEQEEVGRREFVQMRRVMRRKRNDVAGAKVKVRDATGRLVPCGRQRSLDGLTVTNLTDGFGFAERLLRWAESSTR